MSNFECYRDEFDMFFAEFCRLCVPQKNERKGFDLKSSPYGSPVFRSPAISRSASPGTPSGRRW